jgi:hypothetical protein
MIPLHVPAAIQFATLYAMQGVTHHVIRVTLLGTVVEYVIGPIPAPEQWTNVYIVTQDVMPVTHLAIAVLPIHAPLTIQGVAIQQMPVIQIINVAKIDVNKKIIARGLMNVALPIFCVGHNTCSTMDECNLDQCVLDQCYAGSNKCNGHNECSLNNTCGAGFLSGGNTCQGENKCDTTNGCSYNTCQINTCATSNACLIKNECSKSKSLTGQICFFELI